jgi:aryl-alcohol dehydrogenase-like predicted oxidoreductase
MARDESNSTDRRAFLRAGAAASASAFSLSNGSSAQESQKAAAEPPMTVPRRLLGKTGVEVTMLDLGSGVGPGTNFERILRAAYASGIRTFDTAKIYGTEPNFKRWFQQMPEVRKEIFLIAKERPRRPSELLTSIDERLKTLGTHYVDMFFIHALGDHHSLDDAINMVTSQEFKETAEALRKSGKTRFVGFSSHHKDRPQIIHAAAKANHVDAIMVQYRPWLDPDSPLNRALDACHKNNIGVISMKQIAGVFSGDKPNGNILNDIVERVPMLKERNLTPFQGLLHAIWTDERISCSCVTMRNTDRLRENVDAARRFKPIDKVALRQLRDAAIAQGQTLCADCDGRCSRAAGTDAELGDLTRFLTYYTHHGDRVDARRRYAALPPSARDWSGADLDAARSACPNHLDFARLLPEVDRYLA